MSWKDDLDQDFTIQTGDGKIYTVLSNKYSKIVVFEVIHANSNSHLKTSKFVESFFDIKR